MELRALVAWILCGELWQCQSEGLCSALSGVRWGRQRAGEWPWTWINHVVGMWFWWECWGSCWWCLPTTQPSLCSPSCKITSSYLFSSCCVNVRGSFLATIVFPFAQLSTEGCRLQCPVPCISCLPLSAARSMRFYGMPFWQGGLQALVNIPGSSDKGRHEGVAALPLGSALGSRWDLGSETRLHPASLCLAPFWD